eukprot:SAG11_NODE_1989_length_3958_cov_3.157554_1_plen_90_part_00
MKSIECTSLNRVKGSVEATASVHVLPIVALLTDVGTAVILVLHWLSLRDQRFNGHLKIAAPANMQGPPRQRTTLIVATEVTTVPVAPPA